jgi:hypothetical protein
MILSVALRSASKASSPPARQLRRRRFREFRRFLSDRSGLVNQKMRISQSLLIPKRISNAPSAAIKTPDAVSWLTRRPLQPGSSTYSSNLAQVVASARMP